MRESMGRETQPLAPRNGVLVLSGYGLRVAVERGQLVVADGIGRERRAGRLARATSRLRRLVVLGHAGTISFEALRWLADIKAAFVQIDADGTVIAATAPSGLNDPRLRRAQALATTNDVGLRLARDLLAQKLCGQVAVLEKLPDADRGCGVVAQALTELAQAASVEQLRDIEARAAVAYWQTWSPLEVPWARKEAERVPAHWRTFGTRSSPLTGSPRSAANPVNALLNYLYAILEAETRIALLTMDLDPGLGVLHADQPARDSLALDVMEAVRPRVDAYLLRLLEEHVFAARDFFETRQGVCRVLPPLTQQLAVTALTWAPLVGPVAESTAQAFIQVEDESSRRGRALPTPLSEANRSSGRDRSRRHSKRTPCSPEPDHNRACPDCGVVIDVPERTYCDDCLAERRVETVAAFVSAGPAELARRRALGDDPAHGGEPARKRGRRNAEHIKANAEWEQAGNSASPGMNFAQDILPGLQGVPLSTIEALTGLSHPYCSLIRRGLREPHPRHWASLADVPACNVRSHSTRVPSNRFDVRK